MVVSIPILIGYATITIAGLETKKAVFIYIFKKLGVSVISVLSFAFIYNWYVLYAWEAYTHPSVQLLRKAKDF